jgi:hypothetical protein
MDFLDFNQPKPVGIFGCKFLEPNQNFDTIPIGSKLKLGYFPIEVTPDPNPMMHLIIE